MTAPLALAGVSEVTLIVNLLPEVAVMLSAPLMLNKSQPGS